MGFIDPARIAWQPQPGPQTYLLSCPIEDVMFGGARGGGKSDSLLGDWLDHAGTYGVAASGLLVRRTTPQLEELLKRSREIFPLIGAKWCAAAPIRDSWHFPNGAVLKLRWLERDQDADNFQGHQNSWVGVDEGGTWPSPDPLDKLRATLRSPHGIPCVMRTTANPGGLGHEWLKERYVKPAPPMTPFYDAQKRVMRVFIPSKLQDNAILMRADPGYMDRIRSSGPEWLVRAWLDGDWDASAGDSFFTTSCLLLDGAPVAYPTRCDYVFATIDTAVKTGKKRDGTAVCYWAYNPINVPLTILDWDVLQIEGASLVDWLPSINARLEGYARDTNARAGNLGCFIEDKVSGSILIQQALKLNLNITGIDSKLTALGKDERALLAAPYVYRNLVKISEHAYHKTAIYKSVSKNHFLSQVTGFRLGMDNQEDDALDTFAYGVIIALGNGVGV